MNSSLTPSAQDYAVGIAKHRFISRLCLTPASLTYSNLYDRLEVKTNKGDTTLATSSQIYLIADTSPAGQVEATEKILNVVTRLLQLSAPQRKRIRELVVQCWDRTVETARSVLDREPQTIVLHRIYAHQGFGILDGKPGQVYFSATFGMNQVASHPAPRIGAARGTPADNVRAFVRRRGSLYVQHDDGAGTYRVEPGSRDLIHPEAATNHWLLWRPLEDAPSQLSLA